MLARRCYSSLYLAITLPVLTLARSLPAQAGAATGSYTVRICRATCRSADSPHVIAAGVLVLLTDTLTLDDWPDSVQTLIRRSFRAGRLNGCYELHAGPAKREAEVAIRTAGLVAWAPRDSAAEWLTLYLYETPLSSYGIAARRLGDSLDGRGGGSSPGAFGFGPSEWFGGVRQDKASVPLCVRMILKEWARIRAPASPPNQRLLLPARRSSGRRVRIQQRAAAEARSVRWTHTLCIVTAAR